MDGTGPHVSSYSSGEARLFHMTVVGFQKSESKHAGTLEA